MLLFNNAIFIIEKTTRRRRALMSIIIHIYVRLISVKGKRYLKNLDRGRIHRNLYVYIYLSLAPRNLSNELLRAQNVSIEREEKQPPPSRESADDKTQNYTYYCSFIRWESSRSIASAGGDRVVVVRRFPDSVCVCVYSLANALIELCAHIYAEVVKFEIWEIVSRYYTLSRV